MTIRRLVRALLLLAVPAAFSTPLFAQGKDMGPAGQYYAQPKKKVRIIPAPRKQGGEVEMTVAQGGHIEEVKDEYTIAEGGVVIKYQDITIQADKMTRNHKTNDVVAQGHVIIDQGPTRIAADHAIYNLDTKLGTFFTAQGALDPQMFFTGEKIEKVDEDEYKLYNGVFTSCDLDNPSWSFDVRFADVTLDDYAHMHDLTFRAHRFPIFWAPRLIWPTKKDRSQGFLIPRISFSNRFGQRLELGYFIPMGTSSDVTIYGDLDTKAFNGIGIDLRYLPTPNVKIGELNAYTVHDAETGREQWKYNFRHAQDNVLGLFRGVVDVEDFSNIDFFRKFDRDPRIHTLGQLYSSAYLTRNTSTYSFNFLTDRRDLFGTAPSPLEAPPRQRFEQVPSLQFREYPTRILGSPLYFSLESSMSHLKTSGLISGPTADYYRGDIFPTLSLQLRTPAWFSIRPQISARETYYTASLSPATADNPLTQQEAVDQSLRRFYAQGEVETVGPSFSRIFNKSLGGFTRFKHVIEPRIRYLYTTNVTDQDRVIRFDTVDSPFLPIVRDSIEYSLTQRLIGREKGQSGNAREVLSFTLRQTASLSKPFTSATGGGLPSTGFLVGQNSKYTPLVASLHVNPYQSITLDATTTFGHVAHQADQTSLSANLFGTGKNQDKYLSFTWFATFQTPGITTDTRSSQIRLNSGTAVWKERIRADVQLNYDIHKGTFLEQRYLIGGNASCYGLAFEFRRYLVYDPFAHPITSYGLAVTLKNVGTIGTH
jgi:LPS-assembly protein